jgi:tetratricopeptide (TPR) repeat protein
MPQSPFALEYAYNYLSTYPDAAKANRTLLEAVLAGTVNTPQTPGVDEYYFSPADLLELRAGILEKLGRNQEAAAAWAEASAKLEAIAKGLAPGTNARGLTMARLNCFSGAGQLDKAQALADEYRAKFPQEMTFHLWSARLMRSQQKFTEALIPAQRAYELSYGDNKLMAAELLEQLYADTKNRAAAAKLREATLREFPARKGDREREYLRRQIEAAFKRVS